MVEDKRKRPDRPRGEHGHYSTEYPVERVLAAFTERDDPSEPLSAPEVADILGCDRRTATQKLETLAERDEVRTKKIGARARVWWRPGGGESSEQ